MNARDSGELSLDAIMREVREALDRPSAAPSAAPARKSAVRRFADRLLPKKLRRA